MQRPDQPLAWGRHYAMVRPDHFRVDYRINPYMDLDRPAGRRAHHAAVARTGRGDRERRRPGRRDRAAAGLARHGLRDEPRTGCSPASTRPGHRVVMSHMRYAERRREAETVAPLVRRRRLRAVRTSGATASARTSRPGDAFPYAGRLVVGYGPRTEELALKHLATELDVQVVGVQITHPGMYHLDLGFCPLDERRAMVCPAAFDAAGARAAARPGAGADRAHRDGGADVLRQLDRGRPDHPDAGLPAGCARAARGRRLHGRAVDVSEFHKGGGSIRCLTNPLDVTLGRDLERVPGGRVVLPR